MPSQMMNLFATPLYQTNLERAFTPEESEFFRKELAKPMNAISNFSSANKSVLQAEEMKGLRGFLQKCLSDYFRQVYNTSNDVDLKITQSWLTLTRQQQSHHVHTHPNSVASGILYINLAKRDGINFYRNDDLLWYELMRAEDNYYNAHRYFIEAKVGDILIFPSNVKHGVATVEENVERISLAFNSFFDGQLGREEFSNALNISLAS